MASGPRRYCMGCGEPVDTHIVERDGTRELRCLYCGLTLKILDDSPVEKEAEKLPDAVLEPVEESISAGWMIIADDSDFLREFMKKLILKKGLAKEVVACCDGQEFITAATKLLASDNSPI